MGAAKKEDIELALFFITELSEFMGVLDNRLAKKQNSTTGLQLVARKVRKEGTLSDCQPPPDAPHWAVVRNEGTWRF